MKHDIRRVFVAGGTGFLGYYSVLLFLERKAEVGVIALPNEIDLGSWYPADANVSFGDLFAMEETDLVRLFTGYDSFVYALGPDDRVVPDQPAYRFFQERLVQQAKRILAAAKKAGVARAVVLNSYFSTYDRLYQGKLSRHHPYIRARIEQEKECESLSEPGSFDVMFLELPYIFGTMPGRKPLWKDHFLAHFDRMPAIMFPWGGGSAMVDVHGVAQAVYAALANGTSGGKYGVVRENMTFFELLKIMQKARGSKKPILLVPPVLAALGTLSLQRNDERRGKESGLHYGHLMLDIQCRKFYLDYGNLRKDLKYDELDFDGGGDVRESIAKTIRNAYGKEDF